MDFPDCPFIEESQTPLAQIEANHHTSIHIDTPIEICQNPEFDEGFEVKREGGVANANFDEE